MKPHLLIDRRAPEGRVCCRCGSEFTGDRRPVAVVDLDAHRHDRKASRTGCICNFCATGVDQ